jgi:hypothetical protein
MRKLILISLAIVYALTLAGQDERNTNCDPSDPATGDGANGQPSCSSKTCNRIITYMEEPPIPFLGYQAYVDWINKSNTLKYLSDTLTIDDRVYVEFYVDTTGHIIDVKKHREIGEPYDTEAIRLIQEHPNNRWRPAVQQGRKLKTRFVIPVYFVDERPTYKRKKRRKN